MSTFSRQRSMVFLHNPYLTFLQAGSFSTSETLFLTYLRSCRPEKPVTIHGFYIFYIPGQRYTTSDANYILPRGTKLREYTNLGVDRKSFPSCWRAKKGFEPVAEVRVCQQSQVNFCFTLRRPFHHDGSLYGNLPGQHHLDAAALTRLLPWPHCF